MDNWVSFLDDFFESNSDFIKSCLFSENLYEIEFINSTRVDIYISGDFDLLYDVIMWNDSFGLPVEDLGYLFNEFDYSFGNAKLILEILEIPLLKGWTLHKKIVNNKVVNVDVYYGVKSDINGVKAFSSSDYSYNFFSLLQNLGNLFFRKSDKVIIDEILPLTLI